MTDCAHIALLADDGKHQLTALVDVKDCRLAESRNLAGDGSDTVTLDRVEPKCIAPVPDGFDATSLLLMGSAIRSVQTAGALETMLISKTASWNCHDGTNRGSRFLCIRQ